MNLVAVIVVLAVVGVVAAVVTGAIRAEMDEPTSSLPQAGVPEGELLPDDLQAVRFSLGFRGYRMDEVDQVLDRAAVALVRRDAEIERLRGLLGRAAAGSLPHAAEDAGAWPESGEVSEHRGRHLRPAENEAPRQVAVEEHGEEHGPGEHASGPNPPDEDRIAQRADAGRTEQRTDAERTEQRTDEGRPDEHGTDEHRTDEHRTDEHRARQPGSNGAAPAPVAPGARRPEWSGSDGT